MSDEVRYAIRRLGWHQAPHGDAYTRRLPTADPVEWFDDFDSAEYRRRDLEHALRASENPFRFGGAALFFQTSLDGPRLHDWLLDAGIDPPAEQLRHDDWKRWWEAFAHTWTDDQLAHAWQALDKVRFFDVAAEEDGDPLRVVQELAFVETAYRRQDAEREGGRVSGVFRTARGAAAACARLNAQRRGGGEQWYYRYLQRYGYGQPDERAAREAVFFEVVDVPGDVPRFAGVGFLVQRRAIAPDGYICRDRNGRDTGSRVPVRVFADRAAAAAHRDELIASAHEAMNPFQVHPLPTWRTVDDEFLVAVRGLNPPLPWPTEWRAAAWREWWDLCQDDVSPAQRAAAWELFADHPLFEVLTVEVRDE